MSKRKRTASNLFIEGLTSDIIANKAASFSYQRGQEILANGDVIIDSHSNGCIDASISGKDYDISITFEEPIHTAFDIESVCSCPDDRDGCCKHGCAVLLKLIDNQPKSKKRKTNTNTNTNTSSISSSKNKNYSVSELKKSLNNLENKHLIDIINESLKFVGVQKIVSKILNSIGNEQINMSEFKSEIYEAIHQLDRLRPSQQFSMSYKVGQDLSTIISKAEKYHQTGNNIGAMQILVAIGNSISNENNIEGEVWKSIHSGGGMDWEIASLMVKIINSDPNMKQNKNIKNRIASIQSVLSGYGIEDYVEVLDCFEAE